MRIVGSEIFQGSYGHLKRNLTTHQSGCLEHEHLNGDILEAQAIVASCSSGMAGSKFAIGKWRASETDVICFGMFDLKSRDGEEARKKAGSPCSGRASALRRRLEALSSGQLPAPATEAPSPG